MRKRIIAGIAAGFAVGTLAMSVDSDDTFYTQDGDAVNFSTSGPVSATADCDTGDVAVSVTYLANIGILATDAVHTYRVQLLDTDTGIVRAFSAETGTLQVSVTCQDL